MIAKSLLLLAATFQLSSAYKLLFYNNDQCQSQDIGSWVGGIDQGCQNKFPNSNIGNAKGAMIISTAPVDQPWEVVFYSSDNCDPATKIASGNEGCVATSGNPVQFKSYNVIPVGGPTKPPPAMKHGDKVKIGGQMFFYRQIGDGAFTTVPEDKWDPARFPINTDPLHNPTDIILVDPNSPAKRSYPIDTNLIHARQSSASCKSTLLCGMVAYNVDLAPENYFGYWTRSVVEAAGRVGQAVHDFLSTPFFVQYVPTTLSTAPSGMIAARLSSAPGSSAPIPSAFDQLSTCSNVAPGNDLAQAILAAVLAGAKGKSQWEAVQLAVGLPDGSKANLSIEFAPKGDFTKGMCGAPFAE